MPRSPLGFVTLGLVSLLAIAVGARGPNAALTQRESETLRLIARGLSNQEIADILFVHERTVAKYVSTILEKLQLANRTQAALYAIREGLTDEDPKGIKKK